MKPVTPWKSATLGMVAVVAACTLLPDNDDNNTTPPVTTSTGAGTVTVDGVSQDYQVDLGQSRLLLLVKNRDGPACRLFHSHAVASLANNFTFSLDKQDAANSWFTAVSAAAGLDPDQDSYRNTFDETRGTSMTDAERADIRANLLGQINAAQHPQLTFAAQNLSTLDGTGTADVFVTISGRESVVTLDATAVWNGTTLTMDAVGNLDGTAHGIPNGSFSSCVIPDMTLQLHLVLIPGTGMNVALDASVPQFTSRTFPDERACDQANGFDDVQAVLELNCRVCHGEPQQYSAPSRLMTWEDLHKNSLLSPDAPLFQDALERLRATDGRKMPPEGTAITDAEKAKLEAWLGSGAHRYKCDGSGQPLPAAPQPRAASCSTNRMWPADGGPGSAVMHPGRDCLDCHNTDEGPPVVQLGGTVYPSLWEPENCYGASGVDGGAFAGLQVLIKDVFGQEFTLPVNSAGNFLYAARPDHRQITPPYTARVLNTRTGQSRAMLGEQTVLSCNRCHTTRGTMPDGGVGNAPPGRIVAPGAW